MPMRWDELNLRTQRCKQRQETQGGHSLIFQTHEPRSLQLLTVQTLLVLHFFIIIWVKTEQSCWQYSLLKVSKVNCSFCNLFCATYWTLVYMSTQTFRTLMQIQDLELFAVEMQSNDIEPSIMHLFNQIPD